MDIAELYRDFGVNYATDGHKHCRPGWVNTPCPFCTGNEGFHLGATYDGSHFYCWRCGWHPLEQSIAALLKVSRKKAEDIIKQYEGTVPEKPKNFTEENTLPFSYPTGVSPLTRRHRTYLMERGFDPKYLEKEWNLKGLGPVSELDNIKYKNRILIPIMWDYTEVTFQTRDITNKAEKKYLACPKSREILHHKHILYGNQRKWKDVGIVVEGAFDVWRIGARYGVATLGIEYTSAQVRLLANTFKRVFIIFDDDSVTADTSGKKLQSVVQAEKLEAELNFRGVEAIRIALQGTDPADMSQKEADYLVKQLVTRQI